MTSLKKLDWWTLLPIVALPFVLSIALQYQWDDPYITYRYAQNVTSGHGMVYNEGVRVLSTTTPLYTLLLALSGHVSPDLPTISGVIGALSWVLACCVLVTLVPDNIPRPLRGFGGLLLALMVNPLTTMGSEIPFYILLILCSFWALESRKLSATPNETPTSPLRFGEGSGEGYPILAGIASGLATVTRADGVLTAIVLVGNLLLRKDRAGAVRCAAGIAAAAVPWYLFSWIYFGSPIPVTLAAKQHQASVAGGYGFLRGLGTTLNFIRKDFIDGSTRIVGNVEFVLVAALVVVGLVALGSRRQIPPLLQWTILYIVGYTVIGVRYYHWYYAPLYPAGIYLLVIGMNWSREWLNSENARRFAGLAATGMACLAAVLLVTQSRSMYKLSREPVQKAYRLYKETGEWIDRTTPKDASVAALQIGVLGYYSRRTMIDFTGLIQPDVASSGGHDYITWGTWAIQHYRPDYVALDQPFVPLNQAKWFQKSYRPIQSFGTPETVTDGWSVVVYQRVEP